MVSISNISVKAAPITSLTVNINLIDEEDEEKTKHQPPTVSYDPQAPVTRKGILTSFRTGRPMPIKEEDVLGRCRLVTEFEKLNRIGEGTYGIVCKFKAVWSRYPV